MSDNFWTDKLVKEFADFFNRERVSWAALNICNAAPIPTDILLNNFKEKHKYVSVLDVLSPNNRAELEKEKQQSVDIPPLGLMPEYIHKEQRFKELCEAIKRYEYSDKEIPNEWIDEKLKLSIYLMEKKQKQPLFAAAEQYTLTNTHSLSINEVKSCCSDDSAGGGCLYLNEEKLKELVKQRICNK